MKDIKKKKRRKKKMIKESIQYFLSNTENIDYLRSISYEEPFCYYINLLKLINNWKIRSIIK